MDKKTKETIKGIKYNYIALNILLVSMFMFLVALFITNHIQVKKLSEYREKAQKEITELKEELERAKQGILDVGHETNNNVIVSIWQNEDIKQRLEDVLKQKR